MLKKKYFQVFKKKHYHDTKAWKLAFVSSIFKYFLKSPKKCIIRVCLNWIERMSLLCKKMWEIFKCSLLISYPWFWFDFFILGRLIMTVLDKWDPFFIISMNLFYLFICIKEIQEKLPLWCPYKDTIVCRHPCCFSSIHPSINDELCWFSLQFYCKCGCDGNTLMATTNWQLCDRSHWHKVVLVRNCNVSNLQMAIKWLLWNNY